MRFGSIRETLLKGIDTPSKIKNEDGELVENPATPRWLSPQASGAMIAKIKEQDIPQPVPNRRSRRRGMQKSRQRLPGLALLEKPWTTD